MIFSISVSFTNYTYAFDEKHGKLSAELAIESIVGKLSAALAIESIVGNN